MSICCSAAITIKIKNFLKKRDREVWTDLEVLFHDDVVEGRQLFGAEGSDKP